jgi:ornithine cyclodeaminase
VRVLSRADLERLLQPADVIAAVEAAFRMHAAGRAQAPPRLAVPCGDDDVLLLMPAVMTGAGVGAKLVTVYPDNRARGRPTLYATYVLLDHASGEPLALLDGATLTGLRTGATSALAARHLARPDARRVACFGCGAQAAFQLACLHVVRPLERVAVVGRDPQRAREFASAMAHRLGIPVEVATDPARAVREADLVTCATTARTPVVFGRDLARGTHVDLVGAFRPADREADTDAIRRARVVVDTYTGALAGAGDILIPMKEGAIDRRHIVAELEEIVTGARPGRVAAAEITLFKSVGWAVEDLAAARLAWERAATAAVGTEVAL